MQAIKNKWIFKQKLSINGSMDPYKVLLVAKVFTQREGIDFKETFNPIIKLNSIRTVLSIVAPEDMNITQFDVKITFFYSAI